MGTDVPLENCKKRAIACSARDQFDLLDDVESSRISVSVRGLVHRDSRANRVSFGPHDGLSKPPAIVYQLADDPERGGTARLVPHVPDRARLIVGNTYGPGTTRTDPGRRFAAR